MKMLFITWDGPQVTYLESVFVPIFRALQEHGIHTDVLQFRWGSAAQEEAVRQACEAERIGYRAVTVGRRFGALSAFASALRGAREVRSSIETLAPDLLMPRSLMPALAVLAARTRRLPPICFDADGLPADERVDFAGTRSRGPTHRSLKRIETAMVRRSSAVLVRTRFAAELLAKQATVPDARFHVVTNGRDEHLFAPGTPASRAEVRQGLGIPSDAPLLVYSGSVGPQYRIDLVARTAALVRERLPDARLLFLTPVPGEAQQQLALHDESILTMTQIITAEPRQVPALLSTADLGLSFRARTLSMRAVSPIKTGEYLLCGVPVLGTSGIGETSSAEEAGVFRDEADLPSTADWLAGEILPKREQFRTTARDIGIEAYSLASATRDYAQALQPFTR